LVRAHVRTLIVDDSAAVRDGLTRLLEAQARYEVVGAVADAAGALERTRATRPHVVLQDFSMPGVDPFSLTRELAACSPRPAVLVLSAVADAQSARRAVDAGAVGWVLKDAEPQQLFAALLGAAGFDDAPRSSPDGGGRHARRLTPPEPLPEAPAALDARTVWALLRALECDGGGLTAEDLAVRAVLPVATAVRYVQRLTARRPALVAATSFGPGSRPYALTAAGQLELARLERRVPAAQAAPQPLG